MHHIATGASPPRTAQVCGGSPHAPPPDHAHVPPAAPTAARFLDTYCNKRFRTGCGAPSGCNGVRCRHDGGKGGGQSHTDAATLTHYGQARTPHTVPVPSPPAPIRCSSVPLVYASRGVFRLVFQYRSSQQSHHASSGNGRGAGSGSRKRRSQSAVLSRFSSFRVSVSRRSGCGAFRVSRCE